MPSVRIFWSNITANSKPSSIDINIKRNPKIKRFENLIQIAQRMFQVSISKQAENNKKLCDYVFEPKGLRKFDILDGSKADQLFEIGYNEVKKTEINL